MCQVASWVGYTEKPGMKSEEDFTQRFELGKYREPHMDVVYNLHL